MTERAALGWAEAQTCVSLGPFGCSEPEKTLLQCGEATAIAARLNLMHMLPMLHTCAFQIDCLMPNTHLGLQL